ncbi:MAG TPA: helicase-exonuclease AddAB subunit AddB [Bacillaceae bacterium]
MSLRFVIGRSGTGKTSMFLHEIKDRLMEEPDGAPVIYLVPEQMTFQSEYGLINTPGLSGMIRTQVYSFTRLAWRILQETGGASRTHIASTGLSMLIRKIIEENKDELKLFRQSSDKAGFIQHVETILTEFKHYCVKPEDLADKKKELSFGKSSQVLASKLHDLELIYSRFEEALTGKYLDSNDYLTLLADSVERSEYLENAEVYLDGFHHFTPQEYLVIDRLLKKCRRVSVALVLDRPFKGTRPDDLHLFRMTGETYSTLYELATAGGVTIEEDVILRIGHRFKDSSLGHLESQFEKRPVRRYEGPSNAEIWNAANRRAEMEGTAREIRRLVREEGYRYKDIAVVMRNGQDYQDTFETIFHDYEIPYFIDQKDPMLHHPLVELIRSILEIISSNWRYEPVFRAVKTDLLFPLGSNISLLREQMDRLENHVLENGIKGDMWTRKDRWIYRRFQGIELANAPQTDAELEMEKEINESRNLVTLPVMRLARRMKKAKDGRGLCESLYLLLEELDIPDKLEILSQRAEERGELVESREHDQAWKAVVDLLDQFVEILGDQEISIDGFISILDAGLEAMKFRLIPPAIDQVFVANLELSRLSDIKAVFVLGLNDGVIPAKPADEGVFSDEDRVSLLAGGLEIGPDSRKSLLDEEFVAYRAFTAGEEKLYLSCPIANEEGKALQPSIFLKRVRDMIPEAAEKYLVNEPSELPEEEQFDYISHPVSAISYLSGQLQRKKRNYPMADFWWDVYGFYMDAPAWKPRAERILSSLFYQNRTRKLSESTTRELYGEEILASVSRMELFHGCPFSHFISHGLRLKEREIFKLEAPHIGDLFHAALKWIADEITKRNLSWASLTKDQCEHLAREAVEHLAPLLRNQILLSSNRHAYLKRKLEQIIGRASGVLSAHAKTSGFSPVGIELGFGPKQKLPPFAFTLKNGTRMLLQGRIDRVDKAEDESGLYLRIIDYKSSARDIDMNEVYHGLALQMLTYLDVIITHSEQLVGTKATPAGILYFHMHNPVVDSNKILTMDDIEKELMKSFRMKGLVLGDEKVVRLMDSSLEKGSSHIIPAGLKTDGTLSSSSKTADEEQFRALRSYVRDLYKKSGNDIISGRVDIEPYKLKERTPCQYCSYRPVCQFDQSLESNRFKMIAAQNEKDLFEKIREEAEKNENSHSS